MADKIVVMHDGIVEQMGAPLDLYERPANLFVAGFIGSPAMNFQAAAGADAGSSLRQRPASASRRETSLRAAAALRNSVATVKLNSPSR
jgi:ABC-type sugar transport system ATPase subunit